MPRGSCGAPSLVVGRIGELRARDGCNDLAGHGFRNPKQWMATGCMENTVSLDLHYQMAEIGRLIGAYQYVACLRLVLMKSVAGSILSWSQQGVGRAGCKFDGSDGRTAAVRKGDW